MHLEGRDVEQLAGDRGVPHTSFDIRNRQGRQRPGSAGGASGGGGGAASARAGLSPPLARLCGGTVAAGPVPGGRTQFVAAPACPRGGGDSARGPGPIGAAEPPSCTGPAAPSPGAAEGDAEDTAAGGGAVGGGGAETGVTRAAEASGPSTAGCGIGPGWPPRGSLPRCAPGPAPIWPGQPDSAAGALCGRGGAWAGIGGDTGGAAGAERPAPRPEAAR